MKTMFPDEIFKNIEKKDGYIALLFYLINISILILSIYIFKDFVRGEIYSKELRQLITGVGYYIVTFIIILIILRIRKQKLSTIGIRREGLLVSMGIGLSLNIIMFVIHICRGKSFYGVLYSFIFYVVILGFSEEIAFRGFIWPRLVVLFGKKYGTIVSGALFGILHAPMKIIMLGNPILMSIFYEIGGGIVISLLFVFIYTRKNNIALPALIHGVLDFIKI